MELLLLKANWLQTYFLYFEGSAQQLALRMDFSEQDLKAARNKLDYSMRKDDKLKKGYNEAALPNGKLDKRKAKFCLLAWTFKQKKLVCSSMFGVKECYVRFNMFCCCNLVVLNSRSSVQIQRGSCIFRKDLEQHSLDKIFFLVKIMLFLIFVSKMEFWEYFGEFQKEQKKGFEFNGVKEKCFLIVF